MTAPCRTLTWIAGVNVLLHVVGLAFAAFGMRPGTPLVALDQRLDYLSQAPPGWTGGWATWMLCTAALISFLAVVQRRLGDTARLGRLGLMIAVVAAGFDLFCDSVYIAAFPVIASRSAGHEPLFLAIERLTGIASLVIANGGYSVAVLLFALDLRSRTGLVRFTTEIGYAVAGCGLLLAGAGFTGVPWHAEYATGPTIGLFCVWVVLVARSLERSGRTA